MSSKAQWHGMIEAIAPTEEIRRSYDFSSHFYGWVAAPFEHIPRMIGLDRAAINPSDKVLEVAVGPGNTFVEILKRVDRKNIVCGVDLSSNMLAKTQQRATRANLTHFELVQADTRQLPHADRSFDVLYNSFMLDLIPLSDMPKILAEFRRVLKPGGRLVLVNMSKPNTSITWWEHLYRRCPHAWVPYVLGGCRPVLMEKPVHEADFTNVQRQFVPHVMPSEVVVATKAM